MYEAFNRATLAIYFVNALGDLGMKRKPFYTGILVEAVERLEYEDIKIRLETEEGYVGPLISSVSVSKN